MSSALAVVLVFGTTVDVGTVDVVVSVVVSVGIVGVVPPMPSARQSLHSLMPRGVTMISSAGKSFLQFSQITCSSVVPVVVFVVAVDSSVVVIVVVVTVVVDVDVVVVVVVVAVVSDEPVSGTLPSGSTPPIRTPSV